ncbi:cytochrome-c peroxidase [Flavobacterium rhizosphaerae]|uniref:Cytochrome c peroxidase n=1 Tax=Flavobacterium rhizosphaerae TaxID=3163298 RepID=A0ABW8YSI7_9FLAO
MKNYFLLLGVLFTLLSCSDDKDYISTGGGSGPDSQGNIISLPDVAYNYSNPDFPDYFFIDDNGGLPSSVNGIDNTPSDNEITDAGATLGRVLFYDKNLSANRTTACGSCHRPEKAFADSSPLSQGLHGENTKRNAMTMVNLRFYKRGHFFYDERAETLELQVLMPILDQKEMALTEPEITQRVAEQPYYSMLFIKAFGSSSVTTDRISKALSQFIRSMVSYTSKYDEGRAQVANMADPFPNFSQQENRGKELFLKPVTQGGVGCYSCHTTEAFVSPNIGPVNNGLDAVTTNDEGAYDHYGTDPYKGKFKIPTLRNIVLTSPYMHDGRFSSLVEVIDFYDSGVQDHPNLSPALKDTDGQPRKLHLSQQDKSALMLFLNTLTDTEMTHDVKFSDPFINQHL